MMPLHPLVYNSHHLATEHLHEYSQFTIYCLEVHLQCCEAQPISAISPKICTLKPQLLHNTKRPTKWSGDVKMIAPQRTSTYERPFTQEGNYLVSLFFIQVYLALIYVMFIEQHIYFSFLELL